MARVEFTNNYQDQSTASGFQFKFFCEHEIQEAIGRKIHSPARVPENRLAD